MQRKLCNKGTGCNPAGIGFTVPLQRRSKCGTFFRRPRFYRSGAAVIRRFYYNRPRSKSVFQSRVYGQVLRILYAVSVGRECRQFRSDIRFGYTRVNHDIIQRFDCFITCRILCKNSIAIGSVGNFISRSIGSVPHKIGCLPFPREVPHFLITGSGNTARPQVFCGSFLCYR